MRILKENTLGLVIDIQEKLFPYIYQNEQLVKNVKRFVEGLKILEIPILVTEQYKKGLGLTIAELETSLYPVEPLEKMSFSCCDDSVISSRIADSGKNTILLCGIESHICVLQTAIDLVQRGYRPVVIANCTSSRNEFDKQIALERMKSEGVLLATYESILFELCRMAGTDQFRSISKLIR
jgi:nicotinamidase-related amidase